MKLKVFRDINNDAVGFSGACEETLSFNASSKISEKLGLKNKPSQYSFENEQKIYLRGCNLRLFSFFKEFLADSFLFSALSFKNTKGLKPDIEIIEGDDPVTKYNINKSAVSNWEEVRKLLTVYIGEMYDQKMISLTDILIGRDNPFDLFFIDSDSEYESPIVDENARINTYKLNDIEFTEDIDKFFELNKYKIDEFIHKLNSSHYAENERDKYGRYVWNFKRLANLYTQNHDHQDILFHFIKSSALRSEYNILLSLATNRFLTEDELVFIDLLIHRIVSETAIEKANEIERIAKEVTQKAEEIERIAKEVTQHATRAAISQAMSRNASHNGNHVLNRLTDGKILRDLKVDSFKIYIPLKTDMLEDDEKDIYHQMAFYINYIKCRMDYLSDITFAVPVMHTNKKVFSELYKDFDKVRLLLEYISGLDNFKYQIKFTKDGVPITEDNDFSVALPNDLLGCQAFYNILENIIRNTAKHNQNKESEAFTVFTVNFTEVNCHSNGHQGNELKRHNKKEELEKQKCLYYQVEVFDSIRVEGSQDYSKISQAELKDHKNYRDRKDKPATAIDWLVDSQNIKLNKSVLDETTNKLRNSSLGLLEMEASAAYLRKLDVVHIEAPEYEIGPYPGIHIQDGDLTILKAFATHDNCLGYRFFISKPTEFLFIGDYDLEQSEVEQLINKGIWLRSETEFRNELERGEVFNHQFVIYEQNSTKKICDENTTSLPVRLLKSDGMLNFRELNCSFEKIEDWVWQKWFDTIKGNFTSVNAITSYDEMNKLHNEQGRYNIGFSDHNKTWEVNKKDFRHQQKKLNYLESLPTAAQKKLPNFGNSNSLKAYLRRKNGHLTNVTKQKLFEAATNNILVIDERIQRFSKTSYKSQGIEVPNKDIFKHSNVKIPKNIDLASDNYSSKVITNIEKYIYTGLPKCKFLLIHYSILERMYDSSTKKISDKLEEWSEKTRIVVTSGRGKPPELPNKKVTFVHLSPILNVFMENRSKYSINYLLNAARR